ncbi:MAG TPA: M28 family peptidase [Vicinamibacterales bacterium]|nr:M28 family peptidase [Vicinamibacterales bacterium]
MKRMALLFAIVSATGLSAQTQAGRGGRVTEPAHKRTAEIGWRLAPADQAYAAIDGDHLKQYVEELTAMSRRYRDNGHPQFWGRIIGTSADAENARWLMDRFRAIGLADVREQEFDLPPQWMPRSWSVALTANGRSLAVETAQPTYLAVGAAAPGLDVDAVWAGFGSEADLAMAPDVRGKAAFFYSTDIASRHVGVMDGAIKRLSDRGAAAVFVVQGIPGNLRTQFYPVNSPVPTFSVGQKDGFAVRDFIASAKGAARASVRLDVDRVPNLKSGTVWGTLPGATDETVMVVAHRDGWFEGANDNASGVATMLGIAEYFAKVPKAQRQRTIVFLGTTGHHNNSAESGAWLAQHPEVFAKTAVLLNSEHTGAFATSHTATRLANDAAVSTWFAGGERLAGIAAKALDAFGVPTYPESAPTPAGEIGRYFHLAPSIQVMTAAGGGYVWHSDQESADTISTTGIAAVTRAYAKIIADTMPVPLAELRARQMSQ